jgi:hypothetical protein
MALCWSHLESGGTELDETVCRSTRLDQLHCNHLLVSTGYLQDKCSNVGEIRRSLPGLLLEETAWRTPHLPADRLRSSRDSRAELNKVLWLSTRGKGIRSYGPQKLGWFRWKTQAKYVSVKRSSMLIRWNVSQLRSMGPGFGAKWSTPKFQGLIPNDPPPKLQNDCTSNLPRFKSFDSDSYPQTYLLTQKTDGSINLEISLKKIKVTSSVSPWLNDLTHHHLNDFFPPWVSTLHRSASVRWAWGCDSGMAGIVSDLRHP